VLKSHIAFLQISLMQNDENQIIIEGNDDQTQIRNDDNPQQALENVNIFEFIWRQ